MTYTKIQSRDFFKPNNYIHELNRGEKLGRPILSPQLNLSVKSHLH